MQFARNICCTQDDKLPVGEKKLVCDKLNCMYKKCGWKRDGYDDDDYKPAWKDDGYSKDDDNKYKSDYDDDWKKDGYDDDDNKLAWKNDGYNKDYDVYQKNKYGFQNDYGDDKCTADKLEECCTANEKKQVMVCATYRCNIEKVSTNVTELIVSIYIFVMSNSFCFHLIFPYSVTRRTGVGMIQMTLGMT